MKNILIYSWCLIAFIAGAQVIQNGSFETGKAGSTPPSWHFGVNRDAQARMVIDGKEASNGRNSLKITNASPYQPHVYGSLIQNVELEKDREYTLAFDIKGQNSARITFAIGQTWRVRLRPAKITPEWESYRFNFKLEEKDFGKQGKVPVRILTEDLAEAAWIDNIRIFPAGGEVITAEQLQPKRILPIKKFSGQLSGLTGIPADWHVFNVPYNQNFSIGKNVDAKMKFGIGYDDNGLIFAADIKDNHVRGGRGAGMWAADSIQLRISPDGCITDTERPDDLELGLSPAKNGVNSWCWQLDRELNGDEADLSGGITPDGYRVTARLRWELLRGKKFPLSFNVIVNDSDRDGHRDIIMLGNGIHSEKSNYQNILLVPSDEPAALLATDGKPEPQLLAGKLFLAGLDLPASSELKLKITDSNGRDKEFRLPDIPAVESSQAVEYNLQLPLKEVAYGPFEMDIFAAGRKIGAYRGIREDQMKERLKELEEAGRRLAGIDQKIKAEKWQSRYLENQLSTLRRQVGSQKRYLEQKQSTEARDFFLLMARNVNTEIMDSLKQLESQVDKLSNGATLPETYLYVSSPITAYRYGLPVVKVRDDKGTETEKPQFFAGYGHFTSAQRDMPHFHQIGANIIQFETGPSRIYPAAGKDGDFSDPSEANYRRTVEDPLKQAWENNLKVCLLLSPHYHPKWWLEKYPEAQSGGKGFLKYEVNHPESRKMVREYLDYLIPKLKASPYRDALHSVQLTNEPTYRGALWESPQTQELFGQWLEKKYGGIKGFNQQAGQDFADFAALQAAGTANPAVNYAFQLFRRETFAEWHEFMGNIVRKHFPEIKISSKIMMGALISPAGLNDAIDPEMFAEISDYNGNDNYMNYAESRWVSNWVMMSFGHDLQYSMKRVPIVNSENHIIKDGETRLIPPEHVYTAIFQQFTQGVGALMTWVWHENTFEVYSAQAALRGNIYHRPGNIIAHGQAALDANRLVDELGQFYEAEPAFALVYSPSSHIQNSENYSHSLNYLYTLLAFTGHKVTFISEKQLAAGKFNQLKAIIATDVSHIPENAANGLNEFIRKGGKVFSYGKSFLHNEYGQPLKAQVRTEKAGGDLSSLESLQTWRQRLDRIDPLPLRINDDSRGIFFRAVKCGGEYLVNIVNYNKENRNLKLNAPGRFYDLIGQKDFPVEYELKPLQPLFLKYR